MKVNELMIGDWVAVQMEEGYFRCRVEYIGRCGDACVRNDDISLGGLDCGYECEVKDIHPIPINAEILEKNGYCHEYEKNHLGVIEKYTYDHGFAKFIVWLHKGRWELGNLGNHHIKYVHELQHALRLCELNEIADNFTI